MKTIEQLFKDNPTRLQFMEFSSMDVNQCQNLLDCYDLWQKHIVQIDGNLIKLSPFGFKLAEKLNPLEAS